MSSTEDRPSDRIWTIPNVLSLARLLAIPLLVWLILSAQADGWAFALLVVSGITDWADGAIARATGQVSRLGEKLDPLVDRAYIAATVIAMAARGIVPWWIVVVLALRDIALAGLLPALRRRGELGLPVHYLGKAATFALLWGFPVLLLSDVDWAGAAGCRAFGWAFVLWGTALYVYAGLLYVVQATRVIRTVPAAR